MRHEATRLRWTFVGVFLLALLGGCSTTPTRNGVSMPRERAGTMSSTGMANLQLAQNYLREGKVPLALERARRAERSDPGSADVQVMLGLIHERIGDRPAATEHYKRAVRLGPNAGNVLNASGAWLCSNGQPAEADALFVRALADINYQSKELVYFNAGKCALDAGQLEKAEGYLRQGLELAPENARLLEAMAQLKFRQGDLMNARAFFQRRDSLGGTGPAMLELAAKIEQSSGDAAAAASYRARLQQEHPDYTPPAAEGTPP
jgi:type IV pilus assembly protein PilF